MLNKRSNKFSFVENEEYNKIKFSIIELEKEVSKEKTITIEKK